MKEVEQKLFFVDISLWIRSRATTWVVFEADYEIKLLVFTSGKKGDNTDIIKLQKRFSCLLFFKNSRKPMSPIFVRTFEGCCLTYVICVCSVQWCPHIDCIYDMSNMTGVL